MAESLQSYHNLLQRLQTGVENLNDVMLVIPANELIADIDFRITQEGKDSDNAKIGDYSKKPWYATIDSFTNKGNFKPANKKNGSGKRASIDLEEGYYELRKLDGKRNDTVVLERTGAGIKNIKAGAPQDNSIDVGFTDQEQADKFRFYEAKNDKSVLAPTRNELNRVEEAQVREYKLFVTQIFAQ